MSLLKEINANAAVAWSPLLKLPNLLALGSKGDGVVGFENTGGEFKLVSMDESKPSRSMTTLGTVKTPSRFTSLAWRDISKHHDTCPYGVVAGGMADGAVTLWNPKLMIDSEEGSPASCEIGKISRHKGTVNAIHFNPHEDSSHLLASGGSDGEVYIMSLEKLNTPGVFTPSGGSLSQNQVNEITSIAWNTQVNYILATGTQNGSVVIWDLKQKKPWCELRDPQRGTISAIAWNPMEGLQIATASGDDQRPVVKLWDLRNSTSTPLAEFHEHSAGVLSLSWCPNDPGLLLSCGKDNRTLLWDLFSRKSLFEFPSENAAPSMGSDQFFGAGGGQRRFNVQWSPKIPAVASACTLDGKVQVWGLSGGGNPAVRPPKWYRRPVGASFGFGGKLVTIANPKEPAGPQSDRRRAVHFHRILSEPNLVVEAEELDRSLESKDFKGHCERKIVSATNDKEKSVWSFMQILFEQDARQHLLSHLGLDAKKINELNAKFKPVGEQAAKSDGTPGITEPTNPEAFLSESINSGVGAEDVFSSGLPPANTSPRPKSPSKGLAELSGLSSALPSLNDNSQRLEGAPAPIYTKQSEDTLMQALLVGNFEVAVNCCLHYNQMADALLLASCGGPELWERTQRHFFANQKRPVIRVVAAIIKNDLHSLVEQSDLKEWKETLSILSTYAKSEEFPALCDKLAARLESNRDLHSATLCYMCAVNVEKTVSSWIKESQLEARFRGSSYALQRLIEKVSIFLQALDQPDQIGPEIASRFAEYSSLMAAQGRLDIAAKYARYNDISCAILKDRIFHAAPMHGYQPPPFPFEMVNVTKQVAQNSQYQQQQQAQAGYGKQQPHAQGYGARNQYGAAQPAAKAATGYSAQSNGYQQSQPAAPTPAYGRQNSFSSQTQASYPAQTQASYPGQQPAQQATYGQTQAGYSTQASYGAQQQQPAYGQPTQSGYGAQPVATGYQAAGYAGQQPAYGQPQQPGNFNRPQAGAGFAAAPVSTGGSSSYGAQSVGYGGASAPAVAQSPGVNSLAAATSLSSSRISTPSVDMSSQKKDGFVSSVGNKELTLKYGNATSAVLSPMAGQNTPKSFNNVVLGSTENVSQQDMPIVNAFNEVIAQLQTLPLAMMEQKQLPEIQKSKEVMFTKLNIGELSPNVVASLHEMAKSFQQRDFTTAQTIYVALTASDWTQHKDWLRGLKALIHIGIKRFR